MDMQQIQKSTKCFQKETQTDIQHVILQVYKNWLFLTPSVSLSLALSLLYLSHILFVSLGNDPFVNALIIFRKWISCCSLLKAQWYSVFISCVHGRCHIFPLCIWIFNCTQVRVHVGCVYLCFPRWFHVCTIQPVLSCFHSPQRLGWWSSITTLGQWLHIITTLFFCPWSDFDKTFRGCCTSITPVTQCKNCSDWPEVGVRVCSFTNSWLTQWWTVLFKGNNISLTFDFWVREYVSVWYEEQFVRTQTALVIMC